MTTSYHAVSHTHVVYSAHDGLFLCACGAVRIRPGEWAEAKASMQMVRAAKRETMRLAAKYGTAVDAYGQRLR